MTEQNKEGVSIVELVSEARYQATFALRTYFGTDQLSSLDGFIPVLTVLQQLPEEVMQDVGIKIIATFFDEERLDPKNAGDRATAAPFSPMLAASITAAIQAIYQQMQQREAQLAKSTNKLNRGILGM